MKIQSQLSDLRLHGMSRMWQSLQETKRLHELSLSDGWQLLLQCEEEDRHGKKSTIISSQLPVASWYDVIGEETIADAILDRLIHSSYRIELKGESLRKKL